MFFSLSFWENNMGVVGVVDLYMCEVVCIIYF